MRDFLSKLRQGRNDAGNRSFRARLPGRTVEGVRKQSFRAEVDFGASQTCKVEDVKARSSHARFPSKSLQVQDVKTQLSCETSFKIMKVEDVITRSFRAFCARLPSKSAQWKM